LNQNLAPLALALFLQGTQADLLIEKKQNFTVINLAVDKHAYAKNA
jgi:hypothetical protein